MSEPRKRVSNPPPSDDQKLGQYLQDVADALNAPEVEIREFIQLSAATTISPQAITVYLFDAPSTATITLPKARAVRNFHYYIKNLSAATLTLAPQDSETIDDAATLDLFSLQAVRITSDNTNHWIL
jgi:hypothetical protein